MKSLISRTSSATELDERPVDRQHRVAIAFVRMTPCRFQVRFHSQPQQRIVELSNARSGQKNDRRAFRMSSGVDGAALPSFACTVSFRVRLSRWERERHRRIGVAGSVTVGFSAFSVMPGPFAGDDRDSRQFFRALAALPL